MFYRASAWTARYGFTISACLSLSLCLSVCLPNASNTVSKLLYISSYFFHHLVVHSLFSQTTYSYEILTGKVSCNSGGL